MKISSLGGLVGLGIMVTIWDVGSCFAEAQGRIPDCSADPTCMTLFERAKQKSGAGILDEALRLDKQAYELRADPRLLFSVARVLQKQGRWEEAISYYELFIESPVRANEQKQTAREFVEQCRAQMELAKSSERVPERKPDHTPAVTAPIQIQPSEAMVVPTPSVVESAPPQIPESNPGRTSPTEQVHVGAAGSSHDGAFTISVVPPNSAPASYSASTDASIRPVYSKWWFWVSLGTAAVIFAGVTTAVVLGTRTEAMSSTPSGRVLPENTILVTF